MRMEVVGRSPRRWRFAVVVIVGLCLKGLLSPVVAHAGSYQVRACFGDVPNRSWASVQPSPRVTAYDACAAFFEGLVSRNSIQQRGVEDPAGFLEGAHMEVVAPPGTFLTGLRGDLTSGETASNGFGEWYSGVADEAGWILCGASWPCRWDGDSKYVPVNVTGRHTRWFRIGTVCGAVGGCPRDALYARTRMRNVVVDVQDDTAPRVAGARGVYGTDGWLGGSQAVGFDATDTTGVQRLRIELDPGGPHGVGWPVDAGFACDYTLVVPCADHSIDRSVDTTAVPDGTHTLRLCASDAAGNWGCLPDRALRVDNSAVGKVRDSRVDGDPGWRAANGFTIAFAPPATEVDGGEHAPIVSRHVEVCRPDGSDCAVSVVAGAGASVSVDAPGPGEWKARVWETDAAGHDAADAGNKGDWVTLRYDPTVPGAAAPQYRNGWTNAVDLPDYVVRLGGNEAFGPSGIKGYAVTTDGTRPGTAVNAAAVRDGTAWYPASFPLQHLPEGTTRVTARAITGAGVPAADGDLGTSEVRVDRTAPSLSVGSNADRSREWQTTPVEVSIDAADQPELSGIDHLEYQVDGGPMQTVDVADDPAPAGPPTATTKLRLDQDGTHTVTARAYDEAGNASPSKTLTVKIDRTGPVGGFDPADPADPTKVSAYVADNCIRSAVVQLRRPGADWEDLPSRLVDGHLIAHIPQDAPRGGTYALRAVVTDCAGNTTILDRRWEQQNSVGQPVTVTLPLRTKTVLRATLDKLPLVRVCKPAATKPKPRRRKVPRRSCQMRPAAWHPERSRGLSGTLKTRDGKPIPNAGVRLQVQRKGASTWQTVATKRTDARGAVRAVVPAGPSRTARLVYAGSQQLLDAQSGGIRFPVRASSTIKVDRRTLRNGQTVRISGRLLGGYVPKGGRELELDGLNPLKKRWQPVQTKGLRAKANGQWSARYRFTATRGRITYLFRLRIAPAWGYPFEEGYSGVVRVTVVG